MVVLKVKLVLFSLAHQAPDPAPLQARRQREVHPGPLHPRAHLGLYPIVTS
jgi:hypothetical protein